MSLLEFILLLTATYIIYISSILLHEIGHLLFIKMARFEISRFVIGEGEKILSFKVGSLLIEVRKNMIGGSVWFIRNRKESFVKEFFMDFGGPLFNLMLFVISTASLWHFRHSHLILPALLCLIGMCINLVIFFVAMSPETEGSDGYNIRELVKEKVK